MSGLDYSVRQAERRVSTFFFTASDPIAFVSPISASALPLNPVGLQRPPKHYNVAFWRKESPAVYSVKHSPFYATLAGLSLIAIGLCLCRYAYTPLIPSMINAHWVDKAGAGYLSGFNCLGYLLGCFAALFLPGSVGVRRLLRISLLLAVLGQTMSAWNLGFIWLAIARGITGFGGASLVIHTPAVVLLHVTENWKKIALGIVFTGAGTAIVLVCLVLPFFLSISATAGWLFEAGLTFLCAAIAWPLTGSAPTAAAQRQAGPTAPLEKGMKRSLVLVGTAYFLTSIGVTPHMLFLTDYLHRHFGTSVAESSQLFALVGVGSLVGALTSGVTARLFGTPLALAANYLLGAVAILMVLLTTSVTAITVSAFMMGFFLLCCVALSSIRTGEISGVARHPHDWGILTLSFGLGLAIGSYGLSGLLSLGASYYMLFVIAQGILAVALLLSIWVFLRRPQTHGG
jgi:predicted MFS family arabinose efflux permease